MTKREPFQFEQPRNFLRASNVGAIYSDRPHVYRYAAWKMWDIHRPYVNFVLDWPGDEEPRRDLVVTELAQRVDQQWGLGTGAGGTGSSPWGGVVVTCLFAYRCASLAVLERTAADHPAGDVIGVPKNTEALARFAQQAGLVVLGWDAAVTLWAPQVVRGTIDLLRSMFITPYALQVDGAGQPVHPLRTHVSRRPQLYV